MQVGSRTLIMNPASGTGDHAEYVRRHARAKGFAVWETTKSEDGIQLGLDAANEEVSELAVCGGDGTVNEVVRGVAAAEALDEVELGVVPAGTGNNFAQNVGVESVEHAFEVAETGDRRDLDLGIADGDVFVNSCMGGLIAEASEDTDDGAKARFGSLAYALQTLSEARHYDGPTLEIRVGASGDPLWTGEAMVLLIGNGRRFLGSGRGQAHMEDGRLEVVILEDAPAIDYLADGALRRVLNRHPKHVTQLLTEELAVSTVDRPMTFSFDGETAERSELDATVRSGAMRFRVGEAYEPSPPPWPAE